MSNNVESLVKEHHVFYEVLPYDVLLEERHGSVPPTTRRVQAGFDIDVYGVRTEDDKLAIPSPHEYALGYAELRKVAQNVSLALSGCCLIEVITFPSTAFLDSRDYARVEGMLRIRISRRGLDQPAGPEEERALKEVEKQLKNLGIVRR
jgi:hypothetical protein